MSCSCEHDGQPTLAELELGAIRSLLVELIEVQGGEVVSVPKKWRLNASTPFHTFKSQGEGEFHALKVDNPSGAILEVSFGGTAPNAGNSDERVPAQTGRVITRPFDEVSIGFDPANLPGGDTLIYVTLYTRALQPTTYALTGAGLTADISDRAARLLGHVTVDAFGAAVDVTDRAGRLLGAVSPAAASVWDVSDRAGRAVGAVSPAAASVWDVSDRAGRALGVIASITAAVDVSDRAARQLGHVVVDTEPTPATGTQTSAASSATDVVILAANANRKGAMVYNDSTQILYLLLANAVSSAAVHTVQIPAGVYYEVPFGYAGVLKGLWAAANGNARVTEVTA